MQAHPARVGFALLTSSPLIAAAVEMSASRILNALAGTYALVNTSSTQNWVPIPDAVYGSAPVGQLIYTASGFMSATITATEPAYRPAVSFPYKANETDAAWATVGRHSIGYAGPLAINTALPANLTHGQLLHGPLTVANVPTMVGVSQVRNYTVIRTREDDVEVTYVRIGSERGGGFRGELWWKKIA
ncbi:hypothetical protein BUE80_DR005034 [Diplocarpon rosae]|nr:hypothetical protein BUE80_DR005034 [Diplocarpon rosae]